MLESCQLPDSGPCQIEHCIQRLLVERCAFGCALDFDELAGARHDDVHIHLSAVVFLVVEIQDRTAVDNTNADCRDAVEEDWPFRPKLLHGFGQGHEATGDAGGTSSTVSLQDIAVNRDRVLAECFEIDNGPQTASDQPLNLCRAAIDLQSIARFASRRASGQHAVFCCDPAKHRGADGL